MLIQIDYQDKRPIYEQVVEKMQNLIVRGILSMDEKIPSVRRHWHCGTALVDTPSRHSKCTVASR